MIVVLLKQNYLTSTIDDSGSAIIDLSCDYYLVGKDVLLYVNIIGKDNTLKKEIKLGEVKKHTLRGNGVVFVDNGTDTECTGCTVTVSEPYIHNEF